MIDDQFWPDESEYADFEADELIDADLPAGHRSGYVAVIGRPNVGKSTLMNHFLGQKIAITSAKPQTTRNQLLGILTLPSADYPDMPPAQVIFMDTPGIHQPLHKLGEYLVSTAQNTLLDADLVVWVVDLTEPPTAEDHLVADVLRAAQTAAQRKRQEPTPVIMALNKLDRPIPAKLDEAAALFTDLYPIDGWLAVSATRGDNRPELLAAILAHLPPGPRYFPADQVTDQQTRFVAAELIREAALRILHQEVPHAMAVVVTEFKARHQNLTYISANLVLERASQKGIVIGDQGRTLKKIGQMARPELEKLLDTRVYLDLWVKIRPKWRKNENELRWLGYTKP
jgi:GTP-binding protein Era